MNDFEMKWKNKNFISCATRAALRRNTAWDACERRCLINFYDESRTLCIAVWLLTVFHSKVNILVTNRNSNILVYIMSKRSTTFYINNIKTDNVKSLVFVKISLQYVEQRNYEYYLFLLSWSGSSGTGGSSSSVSCTTSETSFK